ncbi:hypothetical protein SASPL_147117 [Salvia splendens]|uniref:Cyclin-like domain-containing protein n=1 Tax=Salvia splendens TaxID=180675 RepID=A0A8X8WEY1_SALSN|nr:hypothetical protein SASPL_147117 [Salvia splendens]
MSRGPCEDEELQEIQNTPFAHHDFFWEAEELNNLLVKEKNETPLIFNEINSDSSLNSAKNEAISWMLKSIRCYAFSASTAALAVSYYDRFLVSRCFQRERPWMSQLAAVACLSVDAKVEETQVSLLLDLQVEESKYVFEAKTIQRMELLVLSTLGWRMNPVTPMSFVDRIGRRCDTWEFSRIECDSFSHCWRDAFPVGAVSGDYFILPTTVYPGFGIGSTGTHPAAPSDQSILLLGPSVVQAAVRLWCSDRGSEGHQRDNLVVLHGMAQPPRRISLSSLTCIMSTASLFELYEMVPLNPHTQADPPSAVEEFPVSLSPTIKPNASILSAIAHPIPDILQLLVEETAKSAPLCDLRRRIESGYADPKFTICDGLIYCGRRIYVVTVTDTSVTQTTNENGVARTEESVAEGVRRKKGRRGQTAVEMRGGDGRPKRQSKKLVMFGDFVLIIDGKTYASADSRLVRYLPSVIAAATIIYAIREIGENAAVEYEDQLMFVLRASKREIGDCLTLILEATGGLTRKSFCKQNFDSIPSSPSGVIEAYFSSESSVDSLAVAMSASSSPEPLFKRSKAISIGLANSTT